MNELPVAAKTVVASATAASMRILLMPIDTVKTTMQVEGRDGLKLLRAKIAKSPTALWHGQLNFLKFQKFPERNKVEISHFQDPLEPSGQHSPDIIPGSPLTIFCKKRFLMISRNKR